MKRQRLVASEKSPFIIAAIVCVAVHILCQCFTVDYFGNLHFQLPLISEVARIIIAAGKITVYQAMVIPVFVNSILRLGFTVLLLVGVIKAHKTLKALIAAWLVLAVQPFVTWAASVITAIAVSSGDFSNVYEVLAQYFIISVLDIILSFLLAGAAAVLLILIQKGILKIRIPLIAVVAILFAVSTFPALFSYLDYNLYWLVGIKLCAAIAAFAPTILVALSMKNGYTAIDEKLELGEQNALS